MALDILPPAASFSTAIKSIQTGTIVIPNGATSHTATITSVTVSKAVVVFGGYTVSAATDETYPPYLTLTSATVVTATRVGAGGNSTTVSFTVLEFL